jgi:hypothetical protein
MELNEIITELKERFRSAHEDIKENKDFPNSYASGYDVGRCQALGEVVRLLEGKENA